jgi:WD40 repeat protein
MSRPKYHVFLSHSSADTPVVEDLGRRLLREGIEPWLDTWHLIPGQAWQPAIAEALAACGSCAVCIGPSGLGSWQHEEMSAAIDQRVAGSAGRFRVIPVLLPGADRPERGRLPTFLAATTWVEFRHGLDDAEAFRRLVCGIRGIEPGPAPGAAAFEGQCPYRGLEAFGAEHAAFFFGREALTEWLLDALRPSAVPGRENRFLAILGPSGSGKSSLALAGLVPALRRGGLDGSAEWPVVIVRPGPDPIESLAVRLSGLGGETANPSAVRHLMADLVADPRSLHLFARLALRDAPPARRLVVLVDQFEEVFTLARDEASRAALIDNLLHAATVAGGQTVVVLTMRADFYGKCAAHPVLAAALSDHQVLVGPMTADELRRAIERPALLVGGEFEPGLVERLVHDVEDQSGALPLLQYALLELWQRRDGRRLTVAAYREIGGLQGALENRADEVFHAFTEPDREFCRRIFLRLTQPGEGTEDTKRRASYRELVSSAGDEEAVRGVVERLADARLITTQGDERRPEEGFVEVAHEALIRGWPELRRWIDADRAGLRTLRRLTEAAREWEGHGRDASFLYTGSRLAEAKEWTEAHRAELNPLESDFLAVSRERAANELEDARRRAKARARVAILLAGLSVALVGVAVFAFHTAGVANRTAVEAQRQTRVATVQRLAAQSQAVLETFPQRSLLLAVEAINISLRRGEQRLPSAEQALRQAVESTGGTPLLGHKGLITSVAISPDGRRLVTAGADGIARVWDLDDPAKEPVVLLGHEGSITAVAISPDGRRLVTAGGDKTARVWVLNDPAKEPVVLRGHEGSITSVAISPDGRRLVIAGADGIARVWDLDDPAKAPAVLRGHGWLIRAIAISPDGRRLVTAGVDGTARVWALDDPAKEPAVLRGHEGYIYSVAISPDGRRLVTAGVDGTARVWALDDPAKEPAVLRGHEGYIYSVAISPDGRRLVTAGVDGTARVWALDDPAKELAVLRGHEGLISSVAISPDGRRLVTAGADGTARVWDLDDPAKAPAVLRGHEGPIYHVAISPDGRRLVTAEVDGTARVWALDDPAKELAVLRGHEGYISSVAISPDGRRLVTAGVGATAQVWDLDDLNNEPVVLRSSEVRIQYLVISPDSRWLIAACKDGNIRMWTLRLNELIDHAGQTVGRNFTHAEWQQYFPGEPYRKTFDRLPGPPDVP